MQPYVHLLMYWGLNELKSKIEHESIHIHDNTTKKWIYKYLYTHLTCTHYITGMTYP